MFTKSIYTSISKIKKFSLNENGLSWVLENKSKNYINPVHVPPSIYILWRWKKEQSENMSRAPDEMNNSLSQVWPWDTGQKLKIWEPTKQSHIPDMVFSDWEIWAQKTIKNLENSKVELEGKIKAIDEKDFLADPLEYQNLKNELHVMNKSLIQEYENADDRWEKQEKDLKQKKLEESEKSDQSKADISERGSGAIDSIQQQRIDARSERIDKFLGAETGSENITIEMTGNGNFSLYQNGQIIDNPKWNSFPTRREANRAEIRYRLFSEPPLNIIRDNIEWPKLIDKLLLDTDLINRWKETDPSEPFHAKWLRRLILVALLKKMNPDIYWSLSYNAIIGWQWESLQDQFHREYTIHRSSLGIVRGSSEALWNIYDIVKNMKIWDSK